MQEEEAKPSHRWHFHVKLTPDHKNLYLLVEGSLQQKSHDKQTHLTFAQDAADITDVVTTRQNRQKNDGYGKRTTNDNGK